VAEPCRDIDLPQESFGAERGGQGRAQHRDGDLPAVPQILGDEGRLTTVSTARRGNDVWGTIRDENDVARVVKLRIEPPINP
jgi:hypothetical protein